MPRRYIPRRESHGPDAKERRGRPAAWSERLTDDFVAALTSRDREFSVHDLDVPGLRVRIRTTGAKTYLFRFPKSHSGMQKPILIGRCDELAIALARDKAQQLLEANSGGSRAAGMIRGGAELTLAQAYPLYLASDARDLSPLWVQKVRLAFERRILPLAGQRELIDFGPHDARIVARAAGSSYMGRHAYFALSRLLTWAARTGRIERNPLIGSPSPRRPIPRRRVSLSLRDLGEIWRASVDLPPPWTVVYRLQLLTGCSHADILKMRRRDIDVDRCAWRVSENPADTEYGRWIELTSHGMQLLGSFPSSLAAEDAYLFAGRKNGMPLVFRQPILDELRDRSRVGKFTCGSIERAVDREMSTGRYSPNQWANRLLSVVDELRSQDDGVVL